MLVVPISALQLDWKTIDRVFKECKARNPLLDISSERLLEFNFLKGFSYHHYPLLMLVCCDDDTIETIRSRITCHTSVVTKVEFEKLYIVSTNLEALFNFTIAYSSRTADSTTRRLANGFHKFLMAMGFNILYKEYRTTEMSDGTYCIN